MRKTIFALCSIALTQAALAQEALQCVNPDVLNSLVFNARPESAAVVKRTLPYAAAGFRAPGEFTLIGSAVRGQNLSTVVAYKTTTEAGKAFESLLASLTAEGWKRETIPAPTQPAISVAGAPSAPMLAATMCRDGERRNMLVQEIGGVRYATIRDSGTMPARACGAPLPPQPDVASTMAASQAMRAAMPQFSFPETARMSGGPRPGANFSSGNNVTSTARIESPDSASSLLALLGRQLAAQGWRSDADWKGSLSAGSTWFRNANSGSPYLGTLEILSVESGVYEVGFSITSRPQ